MRYFAALIMLIMCVALTAQVQMNMDTPEGSVSMSVTGVPMTPPPDGSVIDQIVDRLEKLEKEVHVKLNKLDQKKAEKLVSEIYDLLSMLPSPPPPEPVPVAASSAAASSSSSSSSSSAASGTANININISGMEEQPQPVHHNDDEYVEEDDTDNQPVESLRPVMPEGEFGTLISRIGKESFSEDKLRVLRTAAKNYRYNCSQVVRLIDTYTFSEDKLEALRISYPDVYDPQNNYKILDAFTYSSDKEQADRIINE
jgi:hypothetical protein